MNKQSGITMKNFVNSETSSDNERKQPNNIYGGDYIRRKEMDRIVIKWRAETLAYIRSV